MTSYHSERAAQDAFQSMVGETGPYPNDPQHPDPGFDVDAPVATPRPTGHDEAACQYSSGA